jgi:hypothetical protein
VDHKTEKDMMEIARRNALFWAHHVRRVCVPYLDKFSEVLLRWIAPSLSDEKISEAADEVESKAYEAYPWSEDADPSDAAEEAFNVGLDYYLTVRDVRWAVFAMAAATLYHLVEQQVCDLSRLAFFGPHGAPVGPGESVRLLKELGIDVELLSSWPRIIELRHLANCVKHAEGNSCDQLRKLRPELFEKPTLGNGFKMSGLRTHVRNPLMGEDIYVTEDKLNAYVASVRKFWHQLADQLERIGS